MRPTPKFSVCLMAISVGLLLVFCSSVWTAEAVKVDSPIKELQQKRLAILEQIADVAKQLFKNARIPYEATLAAQRDLLTARLDYAETHEDRIKVCDDAIAQATETQEIAEAMRKSARGSQLAVLSADAFLLEAQISREKAGAEK
jgi:outer membrane protein TolC